MEPAFSKCSTNKTVVAVAIIEKRITTTRLSLKMAQLYCYVFTIWIFEVIWPPEWKEGSSHLEVGTLTLPGKEEAHQQRK